MLLLLLLELVVVSIRVVGAMERMDVGTGGRHRMDRKTALYIENLLLYVHGGINFLVAGVSSISWFSRSEEGHTTLQMRVKPL